jgi:hypothetical protein
MPPRHSDTALSFYANVTYVMLSVRWHLQDPKMPAEEMKSHYDAIVKEIEEGFAALTDA